MESKENTVGSGLTEKTERDIRRIENMREYLADFIGGGDKMSEQIRAICADNPDWDDTVSYTLDDAVRKVGVVLAAITNWRRDVTEEDGE